METTTQKMMSFLCQGCQEVKAIPARRGRPPKFCADCRPQPTHVVKTLPPVEPKAEKPVSDKLMYQYCHGCKEIRAIPARRGRPSKYCDDCEGKEPSRDLEREKEIWTKANARVDRLEMMLKARGMHISQNRHLWE